MTGQRRDWIRIGIPIVAMLVAGRSILAADVIAVCPSGLRGAFQAWVDHRTTDGLTVQVIDSQPTPTTLAANVRASATPETRYVVLVGDAPPIGVACDSMTQVPTAYESTTVTQNWGSTPTLSTDLAYAFKSESDDSSVDMAVGRLPVKTPQELTQLIERLKAYEASDDFGSWRQRIELTAGIGGFGFLADSAIEAVTKAIVTSVLPNDTRTCVAYASPGHRFCPTGPSFRGSVLDRYAAGSRFWVYAGHGWIDQLDRVPPTRDGIPVLDVASVSKLNRHASASPIALMLACYTGAFDAPDPCLAETMLLRQGGPIAVIAGSRVTMPYGNTTLAVGLIDGIYHSRMERLGDAWVSSLRKLHAPDGDQDRKTSQKLIDALATLISPQGTKLSDERLEHARLYNLLGDPTLRLNPPSEIPVTVESGHLDGKAISLVMNSPIDGELRLEIDLPIGADVPSGVESKESTPGHHTIHQSTSNAVAGQAQRREFRVPDAVRGPVVCRVMVRGMKAWASGAVTVMIDPTATKRPQKSTNESSQRTVERPGAESIAD